MIAVEHAVQPATKDFLIYRVIPQDGHAEISGESSLETEARRFAGVMEASDECCVIMRGSALKKRDQRSLQILLLRALASGRVREMIPGTGQ